jgi:hypothetical protein
MKKYIATVVLSMLVCLSVTAQSAKELFRAMPDSILPLLTANNRADCTDFMDSKMKAEVTNAFKEKTVMTDMTTDYIALNLSESSKWQMKVLPLKDKTKIICIVTTVYGPVADSRINFYTTSWQPCNTTDYMTLPVADDFFKKPLSTDENDSTYNAYIKARRICDVNLIKLELNKIDSTLKATYTTLEFIGKYNAKDVIPFIKESISYNWKDDRFKY